jgi:hypothetical protein
MLTYLGRKNRVGSDYHRGRSSRIIGSIRALEIGCSGFANTAVRRLCERTKEIPDRQIQDHFRTV